MTYAQRTQEYEGLKQVLGGNWARNNKYNVVDNTDHFDSSSNSGFYLQIIWSTR